MSDLRTSVVVETSRAVPQAGVSRLRAQLEKHLRLERTEFRVDVEFEVPPGFTILFGASGAGKTTLLDCLAGLTTPDSGCISIGDRVLFDSSVNVDVSAAKRRAGYVFQSLALFPHMSVEQNVAYGLEHLPRTERSHRVNSLLNAFRISHLAGRKARSISGGESQRVALARTLVTDPEFLLLDEPLAALDGPTKTQIIDDLRTWNHAHGIPNLYVTHSREAVCALGDRVSVGDAGRV